MKDGHGTWRCRWFGHRLVYYHGERTWDEYPWDWPPDRIIHSAEWSPGNHLTPLVCWRCRKRFTYSDDVHDFVDVPEPVSSGSKVEGERGG